MMNPVRKRNSATKKSLILGAAALALGGTLAATNSFHAITPVYAEAVKVEAPQVTNFADVVEAVSPAVVSVRVTMDGSQRRTNPDFGLDQLPRDHPFRRFFEGPGNGPRFGSPRPNNPARKAQSQGSGFFVSDDGYVVTNNHVVENGTKYTVIQSDGTKLEAKLIGTDPKTDLAVLKVEAVKKFTYVSFANTKSRVGEWVVAVGNPFGLGGTVTAGIISANGRDIGSGPYDDFLQIDAAVNKGNSGGPAFNLSGSVVGVNTAIFSPSGGNVGIAFAISANTAKEVVAELIDKGGITRGWLGVSIQPVTEDIAQSLGLKKVSGAIVADAQPDSPARSVGIRSGDVILDVDGNEVKGPKELARLIAAYEPSEVAKIGVYRQGERKVFDVTLGKIPGAKKVAVAQPQPDSTDAVELGDFGVAVDSIDGSVVITSVEPDSDAAEKGIRAGDKIVSINGFETSSVSEVGAAVAEALEDDRKAVLFQIQSGDRNRFVALPVARS